MTLPTAPIRLVVQSSDGTTRHHEVKVPKPHIRLLRDDYAIANGVPWACSQAGFIARGATPEAAYRALMHHFDLLRRLTPKHRPWPPECHA